MRMENSASPSFLNHIDRGYRKNWFSYLSLKKRNFRSHSSSPHRRLSNECLISRNPEMKIPQIHTVPSDYPYMAVTIKPPSSVFLVYASLCQRKQITNTLSDHWGLDWKKINRIHDGADWIFLKHKPFTDFTGWMSKSKITRAVCICIEKLADSGWTLIGSVDLANQYPASTLFFEKIQADLSVSLSIPCLAIYGSDIIMLINGNQEMNDSFRRTVTASYEPGLVMGSPKKYDQEFVTCVRLKNHPFYSDDKSDSIRCRRLILDIISQMDICGYKPYASLNISSTSDNILFVRKSEPIKIRYMSISLMATNKIRILDAPDRVIGEIRSLSQSDVWTPGLDHSYSENSRVFKFKFKGHPWNPNANESNLARKFLCKLLITLAECGYECVLNYTLDRQSMNKTTFVFSDQCVDRNENNVFCLNFSYGSYCQMVNAPESIEILFTRLIGQIWPKPFADEGTKEHGCHEWTLHSSPWSWNKSYDAHSRALITVFIDECKKHGYRFLTAANIETKFNYYLNDVYPRDAHCIFFQSV